MLGFFRINVPDRLFFLIALIISAKVPLFLSTLPINATFADSTIVGKRLSEGFVLYRDLWFPVAPLTGMLYALKFFLVGNSILAGQVFSFACLLFASLHFKNTTERLDLFPDRTFVPGVVFGFLAGTIYSFLHITGVWLALICLLAGLRIVFRHIRTGVANDELLALGFYLGLALLFHLPAITFLPVPFLAFLLYSATRISQYFLMLLGAIIPIVVAYLTFFWLGAASDFSVCYAATVLSSFNFSQINYMVLTQVFSAPLLFFVLGLFKANSSKKLINFQRITVVIMSFYAIAAAFSLWISARPHSDEILLLLPALAFFISHFFLLSKNKLSFELMFLLLLGWLAMAPSYTKSLTELSDLPFSNSLKLNKEATALKNQNLLVLGNEPLLYQNNMPATPYISRELAQRELSIKSDYFNQWTIYQRFAAEQPVTILNLDGTMDSLIQEVPALKNLYDLPVNGSKLWVPKTANVSKP